MGNVHFDKFSGRCLCPLGETMRFSINKRYNEKTWRVVNNQQLKYLTQVKNR